MAPKGLEHNLLMQFCSLCSSKMEISETDFFFIFWPHWQSTLKGGGGGAQSVNQSLSHKIIQEPPNPVQPPKSGKNHIKRVKKRV